MATQGDNGLVRVQQEKLHDDGDQQRIEGFGRADERYGGTDPKNAIPRVQSYGMSGHPPKGSHAMIMSMEGNPDMASVIGLEHHEHRPKNLAEGEVKFYEKWKGELFFQDAKHTWTKGEEGSSTPAKITLVKSGGKVYINCDP